MTTPETSISPRLINRPRFASFRRDPDHSLTPARLTQIPAAYRVQADLYREATVDDRCGHFNDYLLRLSLLDRWVVKPELPGADLSKHVFYDAGEYPGPTTDFQVSAAHQLQGERQHARRIRLFWWTWPHPARIIQEYFQRVPFDYSLNVAVLL